MIQISLFCTLGILRKSPNTPALIHLLADIEYMWHEIGLALEVSLSDLHELKTSNQKNAAKLSRVIQCWMTSANRSFITWETMIFAMEGPIVYRKSTAAKIYAHLGIEGMCICTLPFQQSGCLLIIYEYLFLLSIKSLC